MCSLVHVFDFFRGQSNLDVGDPLISDLAAVALGVDQFGGGCLGCFVNAPDH
jgi:hypothetical protein